MFKCPRENKETTRNIQYISKTIFQKTTKAKIRKQKLLKKNCFRVYYNYLHRFPKILGEQK